MCECTKTKSKVSLVLVSVKAKLLVLVLILAVKEDSFSLLKFKCLNKNTISFSVDISKQH